MDALLDYGLSRRKSISRQLNNSLNEIVAKEIMLDLWEYFIPQYVIPQSWNMY